MNVGNEEGEKGRRGGKAGQITKGTSLPTYLR